MSFLKTFFVAAIVTILLIACRKKDRHIEEPPTDALSNKVYIGAYGRVYGIVSRYDTSLVLQFKKDGEIVVYTNPDTARNGAEGIGKYTYNGGSFNATITLNRTGIPYTFTGKENKDNEDPKIFGTIKYTNAADDNGIFYISEWN